MSQAYQAPQVSSIDVAEPILAIQRPSPQLLARRAVDQSRPKAQGIQPQRLKVPPQQVKRPARVVQRSQPKPQSKPQPKVQSSSPQRMRIDWEARLREARQRIAQAQAKKVAPVNNVRPTAGSPGGAKKVAVARVGAAVDLVPPAKFSRSVRQSPTPPVIRANDIGVAAPRRTAVADDRSLRPRSGGQLYAQRLNALRNGQIYTQLPVNSFYEQWQEASVHPNYAQWRELLALEARAAGRKGASSVTAMVGDSLSQWFPADQLPGRQLWLNQGISGDTTTGILDRLSFLDTAKPDTIYFMAGVNDLKRGDNERDILRNISQIISRLKRQHPTAQIIVQSILPTRSAQIPNARIAKLNPLIQELARRQGVEYLDLQPQFRDGDGSLRADLTTDGIHLSPQGYQVWQLALQRMDQRLAQRPRTIAQAQVAPAPATQSPGN
jgi:lysophospholipase L1-like esterase